MNSTRTKSVTAAISAGARMPVKPRMAVPGWPFLTASSIFSRLRLARSVAMKLRGRGTR
jgi:hypothetical protein